MYVLPASRDLFDFFYNVQGIKNLRFFSVGEREWIAESVDMVTVELVSPVQILSVRMERTDSSLLLDACRHLNQDPLNYVDADDCRFLMRPDLTARIFAYMELIHEAPKEYLAWVSMPKQLISAALPSYAFVMNPKGECARVFLNRIVRNLRLVGTFEVVDYCTKVECVLVKPREMYEVRCLI